MFRHAWNDGSQWDVVSDPTRQQAVDGGDGSASVNVTEAEAELLSRMAASTMSDPDADPLTGAELDMGMPPDGMDPATGPRNNGNPSSADVLSGPRSGSRSGSRH